MKNIDIRLGTTIIFLFFTLSLFSQEAVFPGVHWSKITNSPGLKYDAEKLLEAKEYSESINSSAVVIIENGMIVDEWGEVDRKFRTHSIRKSFLSAMYGEEVLDDTIDLDKTMLEIDIDDVPPLSDIENQATIRDILKARSGIYHTALYESQGMKDRKPERHSQQPGTHWYYNNWDFNAAGTIFEKFSGKKIFEALATSIAEPIGMENFKAEDGEYVTGDESIHAAYPFIITARDLGRFGLLMLRNGNWNGKQIIAEGWVKESTSYYSDATLYGTDGYGYMWWVSNKHNKFSHLPNVELPEGSYSARGAGGHYVLIIPEYDMVLVHRVDTFIRGNSVSAEEFGTLVNLILEARKI